MSICNFPLIYQKETSELSNFFFSGTARKSKFKQQMWLPSKGGIKFLPYLDCITRKLPGKVTLVQVFSSKLAGSTLHIPQHNSFKIMYFNLRRPLTWLVTFVFYKCVCAIPETKHGKCSQVGPFLLELYAFYCLRILYFTLVKEL